VSDEGDAKILNEVQDRFDVNITELPDEIDLSSYSKFTGVVILSYTLPDFRSRILDLGDIKKLGVGAIWCFGNATGLL